MQNKQVVTGTSICAVMAGVLASNAIAGEMAGQPWWQRFLVGAAAAGVAAGIVLLVGWGWQRRRDQRSSSTGLSSEQPEGEDAKKAR